MKFNRLGQQFWFTSSSGNHQEGVGCPKPKTACPKRFNQQQRNNENLYKMCSIKSRGLGTEINPYGPGYQAFHEGYIQKESMASKRWNLLDCSAFFCYVRTFISSWMDKFIFCQRLVIVFSCFIIRRQREMRWFPWQVVSKIYASESNFYLPRTKVLSCPV